MRGDRQRRVVLELQRQRAQALDAGDRIVDRLAAARRRPPSALRGVGRPAREQPIELARQPRPIGIARPRPAARAAPAASRVMKWSSHCAQPTSMRLRWRFQAGSSNGRQSHLDARAAERRFVDANRAAVELRPARAPPTGRCPARSRARRGARRDRARGRARSTGMPGPSSSTTSRRPSRRAVGLGRCARAVMPHRAPAHLNALSSRLPAISVRSSRSPVNRQPSATLSSQVMPRSTYTLSNAPRSASSALRTSIGAVPRPVPPDAAARLS